MDEVRLKHELVGLERRILGITGDPLGYRLGWCDNYDLQHFKEVLLKEAADRYEGVSLENALLQRCRDYFEDIADKVLDGVGISDIDLYLETLKDRIDKS